MTEATVFALRLCAFAGVHSLLASPRVKRILTGDSPARRKMYRLFYNLISLVLFGWAMSAYRNTPVLYVAPGIWSLVMYLMQALFIGLLFVCVRQTGAAEFIGLSGADTAGNRKPRLVTSGCYRIVRHPLYLFSMLFLLSNPVVTTRWLILTLFSFTYFIIGALVEERRLLAEFGSEYQQYRQKVPFLIPRTSKIRLSVHQDKGAP